MTSKPLGLNQGFIFRCSELLLCHHFHLVRSCGDYKLLLTQLVMI
ncbi:hypothetical protein RB215_06050 [Pseudoalteromonas sp. HL-AS2]|nr:hypothetical protein [Pseudoalteromonas sp. HL-AS2]WMS95600.1 hypothetical protein RB215_06050 [Pseudoalteromonas sp. HL-AS2]